MNAAASAPAEAALLAADVVDAIEAQVHAAYNDGLAKAMATVWEERGRYSVLSPEFFVLTKVWEALFSETNKTGAKH